MGDLSRLSRTGLRPMPAAEALALLDVALRADEPLLVPAALDLPALRAQAADGLLSAVFRGLVRARPRRAVAADGGGPTLAGRLAPLSPPERGHVLLDLVRADVATVLGHGSPQAVDPEVSFSDLGFDSLTAVELRNRLTAATGLALPATAVFDHTTPAALSGHLVERLVPAGGGSTLLGELDRVAAALAAGPDGLDADAVTSRLESMVAAWKDRERGRRQTVPAVADRLRSASADEVLAFLDDELGIS